MFQQDDFYSDWLPCNVPRVYNLEWDPCEEHAVDFPHFWVVHPMAAAAGAFLKSLALEPPVKPGTPDPYTPPRPGERSRLGTEVCLLLACFRGVKGAVRVRRKLTRQITSTGDAILDEVVLHVDGRRRTRVYDPRRVIAGTLTSALT